MYRLDTGQARTDLYKSDPFDTSIAQNTVARRENQAFAEKQAKAKEREARDADLYANMAKMDQMAIMPKDQGDFALKAQSIRDYVTKNHEALRNGDNNSLMEFQGLWGDYMQKAKISADAQTQYQQIANEVAKNQDKYLPESVEYLKDMGTSKTAGQWVIDPSQIVNKIDTFDDVQKNLVPFAKERAAATQTPWRETFTKDESNQLLKDYYLSDPARMRQVNSDFNNAVDKLGAKDPLEYYQNKYSGYLTQNQSKAGPQGNINTEKNKINVTNTVTDGGGEMHVMNKANNEEVTVQYNDKGEVIGGVRGTRLTPEEKTQNDKVLSDNIAKENAYNKALKKAEAYRATLPVNPSREEWNMLESLIPKKADERYRKQPLPYKEKDIKLSAKEAQQVAFDKFGVKPTDVIKGRTPGHVEVQNINDVNKNITPQEFDQKWKALKKGASLIGPDGKTYTKQ